MGMALRVRHYLDDHGVDYELLSHDPASTSMHTAQAAHVPGDQMAKSVVLGDEQGYLVAVLPSSHKLDLSWIHHCMNRNLSLVDENELPALFVDCETGAIPPVGEAYGLEMLLDDRLVEQSDVYFVAGDHRDLVHVSGEDFEHLMGHALHGRFSNHV